MSDRREDILLRMLDILVNVEGSQAVYRNRIDVQEALRPCIVLNDGDEEAVDSDSNRSGRAPRRVRMTLQIYLLASGDAEGIGTTLNAMRASAIYLLSHDTALLAMTVNSDDLVYEGAQQIMEEGRRIEGVLVLQFSITYLLRPSDLASSG